MKYIKWISVVVFIAILFLMRRFEVIFDHFNVKSLDMRFGYTAKDVYSVFGLLGVNGRNQLLLYYITDFIFIIAFAIVQIAIIQLVLGNLSHKELYGLFLIIPIIRGIYDYIENILFVYLIFQLPNEHSFLIQIMSFITQIKFIVLWVWLMTIPMTIFIRIFNEIKYRKYEEKSL